jgi:hypothetical protein
MQDKFARILSYLLHPLFLPLYMLVILLTYKSYLYVEIPLYYILLLSGIVGLTTILFPLFLTYLLYRKKFISSFFLTVREERVYPILVSAAFYYVTYYLLKGITVTSFFGFYMLGATLLAIFALLINFYYKISLHMISMGAFTGLFMGITLSFGLNFLPFVVAGIILSGLLGSARLRLQSHKPGEIYTGFLVGLLTMTLLIILL